MTVAETIKGEEQLASQLENYAGEWVAVRDQTVIAHADELEQLLERIEGSEVEAVFQVAQDPHSACFF
jgi:hypothetical protein